MWGETINLSLTPRRLGVNSFLPGNNLRLGTQALQKQGSDKLLFCLHHLIPLKLLSNTIKACCIAVISCIWVKTYLQCKLFLTKMKQMLAAWLLAKAYSERRFAALSCFQIYEIYLLVVTEHWKLFVCVGWGNRFSKTSEKHAHVNFHFDRLFRINLRVKQTYWDFFVIELSGEHF